MQATIILKEKRVTSNPDWTSLCFETCGTSLEQMLRPKTAWTLVKSSFADNFREDSKFPGYDVINESSDTPYYEGQEPFKDKYYNSYIVNVNTGERL